MKKCVVYRRKSTESESKGLNLKTQKEILKYFAKKHGFTLLLSKKD